MITLCHIDEIAEDASRGFSVNNQSYFAVKKDGQIHLYVNRCPHLGVELNWHDDQFLDQEGVLIQCATHGALFLIENGRCVSGPCLGDHLSRAPFIVDDGIIKLTTDN